MWLEAAWMLAFRHFKSDAESALLSEIHAACGLYAFTAGDLAEHAALPAAQGLRDAILAADPHPVPACAWACAQALRRPLDRRVSITPACPRPRRYDFYA